MCKDAFSLALSQDKTQASNMQHKSLNFPPVSCPPPCPLSLPLQCHPSPTLLVSFSLSQNKMQSCMLTGRVILRSPCLLLLPSPVSLNPPPSLSLSPPHSLAVSISRTESTHRVQFRSLTSRGVPLLQNLWHAYKILAFERSGVG